MTASDTPALPVRIPGDVMDYLTRGATPVELAEAETRAAVAEDGGRTYKAALACHSREVEPSRPREGHGKGIVTLISGALERSGEVADPEAGA